MIWRYVSLAGLVSILSTETLFFCRADKLGDPFEGALSNVDVATLRQFEREHEGVGSLVDFLRGIRKYAAMSCWHINETESAAMWNLYSERAGIAIQSNVLCLKKALVRHSNDNVHIGQVEYYNYGYDSLPFGNIMLPFFCKRKCFEHEHELRALVLRMPKAAYQMSFSEETMGSGVPVKINVHSMIQTLHIAPGSPDWVYAAVHAIIERFELDRPLLRSELDSMPLADLA
ncbi:DUF2971 domain-containing protein [Candidatus Bipolaricaulota bacterium]|nr:DUF2971 domain-containing protein [Candidatus Bipolaricaulota bacterium]